MSFIKMHDEKYMRFPGGKCKALTFSYDDGVRADIRLLKIFKEHGLKGTFNLNSKLFDAQCWHERLNEKETFEVFADCGQEIAMHGARHAFLSKIPESQAVAEIIENRLYLEKKFCRIIRGLAYAYGDCPEYMRGLLPYLGVAYARTTKPTHSFSLPDDWLSWNPTCHHSDEKLGELTDGFLNGSPLFEEKHREPWLCYIWGHSFEFDENGDWKTAENIAKKLGGKKDIWYATNGEICDYVNAFNNLIFSADGESALNPSYMPVFVEIRGKVYEIKGGERVIF